MGWCLSVRDRQSLLELAAWAVFLFLEVYPKMYMGSSSSFYESHWWKMGVQVSETRRQTDESAAPLPHPSPRVGMYVCV